MTNKSSAKAGKSSVSSGNAKQLSNPISTGGGGVSYEAKVQAVYLLAMFTGGATALFPEASVVRLQFQAKIHGYHTDDLVCELLDQVGVRHKALLQVKRSVKASSANSPFKESLTSAWHDFKNPLLFLTGTDRLVIVYDSDADSNMRGATAVAEFAKTSLSGEEFFKKITAPRFSSASHRQAISAIESIIVDIVGGPVHQDELHQFLAHIWFVSHHLSQEGTTEHAGLLACIKFILGAELGANPSGVWAELVNACLRLNSVAASISFANLDSQITSKIAAGFKAHRSSRAVHLAIDGLLQDATSRAKSENSSTIGVENTEVALALSSSPTKSEIGPIVMALSPSRPDSANKVISGLLDAINEKLKVWRYRDALNDVVALGKDLSPFDTHQKARWYLQRGVCYWHLGQTPEAATDFLKASDLSDDDEKMVAARVRGLLLQQDIPGAVKAGEAALERFPNSLNVWLVLANARLMRGDSLKLADVPVCHREEADVLQMLAWSCRHAGDWATAVELGLKSLALPSAGFYTRHAALAIVVESITRNGVFATHRLIDGEAKSWLTQVVQAFIPRTERLWSVQAKSTVLEAAAYLGYAYLLLQDEAAALNVVQEAQAYGFKSPELLRVELDALNQAGKIQELLDKGRAYVSQLTEEGLINLAQVAANVGEVALLAEIIAIAETMKLSHSDTKDVLHALRWMALWHSPMRAKATAEVLESNLPNCNSLPMLAVGTRVLLGSDDKSLVSEAIAKAEAIVSANKSPENTLLLAEMMFDAGKWQKASKCYEEVLPAQQHSELHNRLLRSYIKAGNRRKAKKLIEGFPLGWTENDNARALAIELGQMAGDWALLAMLAETQFQQAKSRASSWLFKFTVDVRNKPVAELQKFLEEAPLELNGSIQQISQVASLELRYGLEEKGMRRLYWLRRKNLEDVESASALVIVSATAAKGLLHLDEKRQVVAAGTSFIAIDEEKVHHTFTIDPANMPPLPETGEFKQPNGEDAKYFLGVEVGGQVIIEGVYGIVRKYRVETITSSFHRLIYLAHQAVHQSLKPISNAVSIPIPTSSDGEADFSKLHAQLKRASSHAQKAIEVYETTPITFGAFCDLLGKSPVDVIRGWRTNGPPLFVCTGLPEERNATHALLSDSTSAYVIDAATITEIVSNYCAEALGVLPKIFVSSITWAIVQGKLEEARRERSSGQAYDDDGRLAYIEITQEQRTRDIRQIEAIYEAMAKYCEVLPAYGPEIQSPLLNEMQQAISDEEYSELLLASEKGAHLLTIDGRLRRWAEELQVQAVWPQVLLTYAVEKGAVASSTYSLAVIKMFLGNRHFISLGPQDLLMMCHQGDFWLQHGISKYKIYLSDANTDFKSALDVSLEFLFAVTQSLAQMGALGELLKHIVEGLLRHKDCPPDLAAQIGIFIDNLTRLGRTEYLYGPAGFVQTKRLAVKRDYLRLCVQEAIEWAKTLPIERALRIKVLMCGITPWLIYDNSESLNSSEVAPILKTLEVESGTEL